MKMLGRLTREPVALAAFCEAVVTLLLALDVIEPELGAALTGIITAGLVLVRQVVTPVSKVATVLDKPVDVVNGLLKGVTG